jgi:hypothetical protein
MFQFALFVLFFLMSGVSFVLDKPVSQYPTITTNPKEEVMHKTRNENQFNKARRSHACKHHIIGDVVQL